MDYDDSEQSEFIPPAPEQPMTRATRMPQIEDLPQVAQNQIRALREASGRRARSGNAAAVAIGEIGGVRHHPP